MTQQEFKFVGFTLVVTDKGFHLVDDIGSVLIDASNLQSYWPIEVNTGIGRELYVRVDSTKDCNSFGMSQRRGKQ